jgi:BlaI family transcriptional regulator, penicillinase repressor
VPAAMPSLPSIPISESEAKVMNVLWEAHPLGTEQIFERLATNESWHVSTIKTLLGRLVKKGAVAAEADGRRFSYSPLLTRQDYISTESRSLLDRLFEGKITPLVSHFAQQRKLSKRDLNELRRLLDDLNHD